MLSLLLQHQFLQLWVHWLIPHLLLYLVPVYWQSIRLLRHPVFRKYQRMPRACHFQAHIWAFLRFRCLDHRVYLVDQTFLFPACQILCHQATFHCHQLCQFLQCHGSQLTSPLQEHAIPHWHYPHPLLLTYPQLSHQFHLLQRLLPPPPSRHLNPPRRRPLLLLRRVSRQNEGLPKWRKKIVYQITCWAIR